MVREVGAVIMFRLSHFGYASHLSSLLFVLPNLPLAFAAFQVLLHKYSRPERRWLSVSAVTVCTMNGDPLEAEQDSFSLACKEAFTSWLWLASVYLCAVKSDNFTPTLTDREHL